MTRKLISGDVRLHVSGEQILFDIYLNEGGNLEIEPQTEVSLTPEWFGSELVLMKTNGGVNVNKTYTVGETVYAWHMGEWVFSEYVREDEEWYYVKHLNKELKVKELKYMF